MNGSPLPPRALIVFAGDSITAAGRPGVGEAAPWEPSFGLGTGYVSQVWSWLVAARPELKVTVTNRGVSGNTVRELAARWDADVLAARPDVVCIMIGINDVWRQFDVLRREPQGVPLEEYRLTLRDLVERTQRAGAKVWVAGPFFIERPGADPMRLMMEQYAQAARAVAGDAGAGYVDVQAGFDAVLEHLHPSALAWDRIHPGPHGHMVIARAFLRAFGHL